MALVAVVKVLLYRYTGQDDSLLGFPITGRTHPHLENQIGFYVNTLPLRDRVRPEASFLDLLDAVKVTATEAYEHQAYPFDRLVDELHVARDVSRSPMFDVVVVMQNATQPTPGLDGVAVQPFIPWYDIAKFDLSFTFEERDGALQTDITYNTDLFVPARIKRIADHLRELVASVLRDPTTPVARLRMLPAAERQQVLALGAPPPAASCPVETLASLFERQAARTPESLALILPETAEDLALADARPRQTMTYAELNARANRLAHALRRVNVGPDVVVGLCLPRSLELVVGLLGILKAGGAYLPLDTGHPAERWAFMIGDAKAQVVVTQLSLADKFSAAGVRIVCLDGEGAMPAGDRADNPAPVAPPDHLAYVIYTSGSTGRPKGVAVTNRNVARLFAASESLFGFDQRDVWTLFHSHAFDFSVWELWGALLYGGCAVIVPYAVSRSPDLFYQLLAQEGVTVLNQTPSAFRQLMQVEEDAGACRNLALRYVIFGGEALDFKALRPWFARHGDAKPRLVNMYGITETTVHVTFRPLSVADLEVSGSLIGKPLPDLKLYLLDLNREPVPIGVTGELYVGGGGVAQGYLNRPELTAERFVADPFGGDPQARLYRSGDLARLLAPDGDIEYLGRIDHQVQIRGFRVELGEIAAVLGTHPDVREAIVLPWGEDGAMRLIGYFIPAADEVPATGELRRHLQAQLPDYMIPAALIAVETFPVTVNGKLDRAALPRPDHSRPQVDGAYAAPEGELEQGIAALFREVLGIERVGLHDNFFDLGANSLLLVRVHRKLREQLARDIPVIRLFQYPTVAALAEQLDDRQSAAQPSGPQQALERGARRKAARLKRSGRSPAPRFDRTTDGQSL
jgi:amino acid adenylation domain-containing protein